MSDAAKKLSANDNPLGKSPGGSWRFWRFNIRQLLALLALVAVLCALCSRKLSEIYKERQTDLEFRRLVEAIHNLEKAVRENDLGLAQQTLQLGFTPKQLLTGREATLVDQCVAKGQLPMLELLLEVGAKRPPLSAVLESKQQLDVRKRTVQLLVKYGADPTDPEAMDVAVRESNVQSGELLRELGATFGPRELSAFNRLDELKAMVQARPDIVTERVRRVYAGQEPTLLGFALAAGHREMSLFLLDAGAPLDWVESSGQTMLHQAARGGDPQLIRLLVARGLDVNARDDYKDTPLRDISSRGKPETVKTLIELGADVNTQGMNNYTPLYSAVFDNRVDIVRILLAAGADPTIPAHTKRKGGGLNEWQGESTLDLAKRSHPDLLKILEEARPIK